MRNVSNDYLAQVQGAGRQFGVSVKVYGNGPEPESLWLGDIISIDILRSCSDQLQIGACMSDKLTLQTKATTLFNGRLKKIEVFYRCTAPVLDWAQLGTFYVDEAVTKQGVTAVTAYDMMSRLDKRVSWVDTSRATAPTFPCKMQAVLNYLCARAGVSTDFTCEDITIDKAPDGYTARELISYIAASHGRNARFSPSEVLTFPAYEEVGKTVQHGRCYSLDVAGGSGYTVKGILFQRGGDDKVYIDGTASEYDETADGIVTAFDPFATVGIAEYAWNRLGGLNYSAVSLEIPAENILEPGDVFTVEDADGSQKKAVVMEQELSLSCTGGFVERISCAAESKAQNRNSENRQEETEKQVSKAGNTAEKLQTTSRKSPYWARTDPSLGVLFGTDVAGMEQPFAYLVKGNSGGFELRATGPQHILLSADDVVEIMNGMSSLKLGNADTPIDISGASSAVLRIGKGCRVTIRNGMIEFTPPDDTNAQTLSIITSNGGWEVQTGAYSLKAAAGGLYFNGKKVLTEE